MSHVEVMRSLGDRGWVCRISAERLDDSWIDDVRDSGWAPLDITVVSGRDHENPSGQNDVNVRLSPPDLGPLLTQRFPPGRPLHQLIAIDLDSKVLLAAVQASQPWLIAVRPAVEEIPGYTRVLTNEEQWWLRSDQQHLAPGIAGAYAQPENPPARSSRSLRGFIRARAAFVAHRLPGPVKGRIIRTRHLNAVRANQEHLVNPTYLGNPPQDHVDWLTPAGLPSVPNAATTLDPLDGEMLDSTRSWLLDPHDSDSMLDRRVDNHGDELGRTRRALLTRLALAQADYAVPRELPNRYRPSIVVDVRSLQNAAFGTRGIGRYANGVLESARSLVGDANVTLLIDPTLEPLPDELVGNCATTSCITEDDVANVGALLQPSPMTASPDPLLPALIAGVPSLAVVHDFIPAHYPTMYLSHAAARSEYAAQLDALALYGEYITNSHTTAIELNEFLAQRARPDVTVTVAWPASISTQKQTKNHSSRRDKSGPIVIVTGDEPRKNTFGALAAVGAATAADRPPRNIAVLGMAGHDIRVHHLSIAAAIREGETTALPHIDDQKLAELLTSASLVVVASFDEGLSLPVIEAIEHGAPVVASDIPAHRELMGDGSFLAPPGDIEAMSEAIRAHRGSTSTHRQQSAALSRHQYKSIGQALSDRWSSVPEDTRALTSSRMTSAVNERPRIAVATPWPPQATGVADFSGATIEALADHVDVTVFSTSDAGFGQPLAQLEERLDEFDAVIAVAGNSHFHLTILETLAHIRATTHLPAVVIAHDTRMVEYYMSLRSKSGAEAVMVRGQVERRLSPSLDEQIDDMRLLQNAGLWEIAHLADCLVLHSVGAAERIENETGVKPVLLPFANQRVPDESTITTPMRQEARRRLGLSEDVLFLASFGYADNRTKLTDVVVEAAAWLTQWGYSVSLHLVGAATPELQRILEKRAQQAGIDDFRITGFASEELFRDYLLGIDVGVQLRISPLLGVSGPLSDMAAFGTRGVASRGLATDVDAPDYIHRMPDHTSPLLVAEAIEQLANTPLDPQVRETQRRAYLATKTPEEYAVKLADVIKELLA